MIKQISSAFLDDTHIIRLQVSFRWAYQPSGWSLQADKLLKLTFSLIILRITEKTWWYLPFIIFFLINGLLKVGGLFKLFQLHTIYFWLCGIPLGMFWSFKTKIGAYIVNFVKTNAPRAPRSGISFVVNHTKQRNFPSIHFDQVFILHILT